MGFLFSGLETEAYERTYTDTTIIKRIWTYLSPYKLFVILAAVSVLLSTLSNLFLPQALTTGIDLLIDNKINDVYIYALIYLILGVVAFLSEFGRMYSTMRFTSCGIRDMRVDSYNHLLSLDQTFFDKNRTGRIMARVSNDTEELDQLLGLSSQFFALITLTIGTLIILLTISVNLSILGLLVAPLLIFVTLIFRKYAKKLTTSWRRSFSTVNATFQEGISGITVSKEFARTKKTEEKFFTVNKRNYKIGLKRAMFLSSIFPIIDFFSSVGIFIVLYFGGISINNSGLTPGQFLLFVLYLQRFYFPITFLTVYYQNFQSGLAATERVLSLMDLTPEIVSNKNAIALPKEIFGNIAFVNISFAYNPNDWVLKNFSLQIKSNEKIGLVGHTGAGKTTLTALLMRLYDPQEGEIRLDGIPITKLNLHDYRNQVAVVFQDSYLFDTTIENNIRYGKPDATEKEIIEAAKAVYAHQFIINLPDGYKSLVGERGNRLSSGQRQLIAFARALIKNPKILILDEATANVDAYTESLIQDAIKRLMMNKTSIVVAHRLSTIEESDRILVIEHGKIIEQGSHEELLKKQGNYADLYKTYFEHQSVNWEPSWDNK
ncbi:MAG: ABC transporter ATP-binding protein [Candidatus Thorarchaeota archaeon]